jgi:hypothetical protein
VEQPESTLTLFPDKVLDLLSLSVFLPVSNQQVAVPPAIISSKPCHKMFHAMKCNLNIILCQ